MKKRAGDPKLAIATIRVSTTEQALGPKAQMKAIEAWAARERVKVLAVFIDHGISGAAPIGKRAGLLGALVALSELGAGVLVAAKRDRLARDMGVISIIASETKKAGATIRTADGASDAKGSRGVIERGMHDIFSEYERAVISERTSAALAVKKARGERVGMVPFGYRVAADGVRLEPLATEQAILSTVRELRAANASTYGIARELTARGLISRALKPFAQTQIVRMLKPRVPGA